MSQFRFHINLIFNWKTTQIGHIRQYLHKLDPNQYIYPVWTHDTNYLPDCPIVEPLLFILEPSFIEALDVLP